MIYYIICAVAGYLIGSIPFGYIIVKLRKGIDIRTVGSGNVGATNVGRIVGWPWGILCFLLDALKGFIPTFLMTTIITGTISWILEGTPHAVTQLRYFDIVPSISTGLSLIIGHLFPVYLRFKGGKGVATSLGVFLVLMPFATLVSLVIWLIFAVALRYISLASIMAAIVLPLSHYWYKIYRIPYGQYWGEKEAFRYTFFLSLIISLLIIIKHIPNIKRLIKGTEPKVRLWRTKEQEN